MPAKLSAALKVILKAPHAKGTAIPAPASAITEKLFNSLKTSAAANGLGSEAWLTLSTATLVTLNSPQSLCELYSFATKDLAVTDEKTLATAAIMREAGLKCISFSGIPRTINSLGALRAHIPAEIAEKLSTEPTRLPTQQNLSETQSKALALWNSIYEPHASKLLVKLAESHPDLPVHIFSSHYGPLLSDPSIPTTVQGKVGRVLTSVVAVACLRAQQGVAPQVASHIFGLRNSAEAGSGAELEARFDGQDFLTSDEGAIWVLNEVDRIVEVIAKGETSFAGPAVAKL